MNKRKVYVVPPVKYTGLKKTAIKEKAGGIPALFTSLKHLKDEIGLLDGIRILNKMNQVKGFDCPGCAWPDPKKEKRSSLGEYCENGVKAIAEEATKKRADATFFSTYSVEEMSTWSDYEIGKSGRITDPMYLAKGSNKYEKVSWEKAFEVIGNHLNHLDNPDRAVFYTSGRTSNEAAFMYQLFARTYGTNNLPDCSNMCHESSGVGLTETLGIGKGSVTLEDFYQADVVMVMGQNPGTNHPRMMSALKKCKENGGRIISVNPLPEAGTSIFIDPQSPVELLKGGSRLSDYFLQIRVNGDVAFLKALMYLLLQKEKATPGAVFDNSFIDSKTKGYKEFIEELSSLNLEEAVEKSGLKLAEIKEVADLIAQKKKLIVCWAMGLTQHLNGVNNVREVVNLLLLKGSIGIPGGGTCPVRGHSNVQGDRTMGIYEKPSESFITSLENRFGGSFPRKHGYDVVDSIKAMHEEKVDVFIGMGGNFISATPDSNFTGEAMQKCKLTVQISTKLNRSHLVTGEEALILPCISRSETDIQKSGIQFVSVENSMGIVHSSKGMWQPASDNLLSEPAIVAGIAKSANNSASLNWDAMRDNYNVVRDHIEAVIPGFNDFNRRILQPDGFYLPNGSREGKFNTVEGKALFTLNEIPLNTIAANHFVLTTIRSHDQYNTTIYGLDDRYRGVLNERRVLLMNRVDMKRNDINEGDLLDVTSHFKGKTLTALGFIAVSFDIAPGCIGGYFPETNELVPIDSFAEKSQTPTSKYVEISLRKAKTVKTE